MALDSSVVKSLQESGWRFSQQLLLDQLEEIDESDHPKSGKDWNDFLLDIDLKRIADKTDGPVSMNKSINSAIIMQIGKVRNVAVEEAHENQDSGKRLLKLTVTDGNSTYQALEIGFINDLKPNTPPGTKIWLNGTSVEMGNNFLLLNNKNCRILGGKVPEMIQKWKTNRDTRGNPRQSGAGGAPPWVPFGAKVDTSGLTERFKSMSVTQTDASAAPVSEEFEQSRKAVIAEAQATGAIKKFQAPAPNLNQINNVKQPQQNQPQSSRGEGSRGRGSGRGGGQGRGRGRQARDAKQHQRDLLDFRNF